MQPRKESNLIRIAIGGGLLLLAIEFWIALDPFAKGPEQERAPPVEPEAPSTAAGEPIDRYSHLFRGRVVDGRSGDPVQKYTLRVHDRKILDDGSPWRPHGPAVEIRYLTGAFEVRRSVDAMRLYRLEAVTEGYVPGHSRTFEAPPGGSTEDLVITLQPNPPITGTVLDARTREPVKGARLSSLTDAGKPVAFDESLDPLACIETDGEGRFSLNPKTPGGQALVFRHPEYHELLFNAVSPGESLLVLLGPGFHIRGTAHGPDGEPAENALVLITGERGAGLDPLEHRLWTGPGGAFASGMLHPGTYRVRLVAVPGHSGQSARFGSRRIILCNRDIEGIELGHVQGGGSLHGKLMDRWEPVAGARVLVTRETPRLFLTPPANDPGEDGMHAVTDESGAFDLYALEPGEYALCFRLGDGRTCNPGKARIRLEPGAALEKTFYLHESEVQSAPEERGIPGRERFSFPLRGTVRAGEESVAYARVCLTLKQDALHSWFQPQAGVHSVSTDGVGRFELRVDEPGVYAVGIYDHAGFRAPLLDPREITVPRRTPVLDLDTFGAVFEADLVDAATFEPVHDAEVHVLNGNTFTLAVPDPGGRILLRRLMPVETRLYVHARGYHEALALNVVPSLESVAAPRTILLGEEGMRLRLEFDDRGPMSYCSLQHYCWIDCGDGEYIPLRQFIHEGSQSYLLNGIKEPGPEIEVYLHADGRELRERIPIAWEEGMHETVRVTVSPSRAGKF